MKVRVYRNLSNRTKHNGLYSVQTYVPGKGWRVTGHADSIALADVTFKVSEAGCHRVLQTGRKNVHAFAVGCPVCNPQFRLAEMAKLVYDPRVHCYFTAYGQHINGAMFVVLNEKGMYATHLW